MFKRILFIGALLIAGLIVVIALQPANFRITRSATIHATPEAVFAQVNNFHHWNDWSPWAKLDPAAKNSFDGSPSGQGAIFKWSGNNEVGEGRMTITESRSNQLIRITLDFVKPFQASNLTEFTFTPKGDQTFVQWTMTGRNNFISKAFGLFVNCDKMVGGQFEQGLKNLNSVITH